MNGKPASGYSGVPCEARVVAADPAVIMAQLEIDLFSDIVCPWCFIGSHRLDQVLASEGDVVVNYRTFMLDPTVPPEGESIRDRLRRKYGVEPERAFATVTAAARESGLDLDPSKQPKIYRTESAHTLLRHAAAKGTQRALARALFEAHFVEVKNISDIDTLAGIATRHGFDADEAVRLLRDPEERTLTHEEARHASEGGINGVPFFVFDGKLAVSGAQPADVLRAAIARAREAQKANGAEGP
ncbi:DsbA family oxidoreductase [Pendulispora rubella]|uniref:DsbA family oxidoreductase n=1 Tax=Pendulispora rubella TaxID=2741070 RepID=A0ABZ2LC27_9BACT